MTTLPSINRSSASPSRLVAAEIRAEMGRQQLSQRGLAERLHVPQPWLSRRLGAGADVDLTLEDILRMAEALGVNSERLVAGWLPRLDSNQQPSGYPSAQVSAVVDLAARRRERVIAALPGQSVDELHRRLAVAR